MNEKSIAILPFLNLSSDPENEYFSDGITEEIINALTIIKGLKVTARTSSFAFKGKHMDVRHIGNQLGVSTVLEGSVRKSKKRIRVSAQLIRTDNGFHIWSQKFDRELTDIFDLQDEISVAIAEQIRENFGHLEIQDHLIEAPTDHIEAYNLYLKARYFHLKWDGPGIQKAIELYNESMSLAPDFSWPYFGAAYCYAMYGSWGNSPETLQLAEEHIETGFSLDSNSFLGYYSKATLEFWGRWNFKEAHDLYLKAITLNPSYTEAEEGLTELYVAIGEFEKANYHAKKILALDPLSQNHFYTIANICFLTGDFETSKRYLLEGLEISPEFSHLIEKILLCDILLADKSTLEAHLSQLAQIEFSEAARLLFDLVNDQEKTVSVQEIETLLLAHSDRTYLIPWDLFLHTQAGHIEKALEILETSTTTRRGQIMNFQSTPLLAPLHPHNRFQEIVANIHNAESRPLIEKTTFAELELESAPSKTLMSEEEIKESTAHLKQVMEVEQKFLDSTLGLRDLAEAVHLHPNKLSWLLNDLMGMSFNDYINTHRLETFKRLVLDPANKNLTLLGMAFESGFNSKTTFNDFFKKKTGTTPRAWLKQQS